MTDAQLKSYVDRLENLVAEKTGGKRSSIQRLVPKSQNGTGALLPRDDRSDEISTSCGAGFAPAEVPRSSILGSPSVGPLEATGPQDLHHTAEAAEPARLGR